MKSPEPRHGSARTADGGHSRSVTIAPEMQSRLALFVLLAVLAPATHAHAWGREGHVIVAEIAQHHLTPEARTAVQDLLDLEPDPKHRTLAQASTWPDRIKSPKHP
jgi:hypothetical protein